MPSKTDFNVSPYYDDFSKDKNFHRVMYRPGYAVQARELTAQQSLLQNQIENIGDHLFEQGAMVIPGNVHYDPNYHAVVLTSNTGTLANFDGTKITGGTTGVTAIVVGTKAATGDFKDTLYVKYTSSGTDNVNAIINDGETITSDAATGETGVVYGTALGSAVHVDAGTYYINGFFVDNTAQTVVLDSYSRLTSYRVGWTITESFITSTDDTSLLDNATGSSNVNATGAHRFKINLTLAKLLLTDTADSNFIELMRVEQGFVKEKVVQTILIKQKWNQAGGFKNIIDLLGRIYVFLVIILSYYYFSSEVFSI